MNEEIELAGIDLEDIKVPKNYKRPKFWSVINFFNWTSLWIIGLTFFFAITIGILFWIVDIFNGSFGVAVIFDVPIYVSALFIEIIENYLGIGLSPYFFLYLFFANICLTFVKNIVNKTKEWEKRSNESFFQKYEL